MEIVQQKIAHLKGLAEGLDMYGSKDGRLYTEIIDIISDLDDNLQHIDKRITELQDYVDAIDLDLNDIEKECYPEDFLDYDLNEEENIYNDLETEDSNFFQVQCPNCQDIVSVDYNIFNENEVEKIYCPICNEEIIMNIDVINEE